MQLRIVKSTIADLPALVDILTAATEYKVSHDDLAWGTEPYTTAEVRPRIEGGRCYSAFFDDELVGTFILRWDDADIWGKRPPDAGYLHQLAIKDGFHGRHLGSQIIDWAGGEAADQGKKYLRLDCPADNTKLCTYYESRGFKRLATKTNADDPTYRTIALYELEISPARLSPTD